jgi:hypothetical protein
MVVHTCNPSTWEAEAGGLEFIASLGNETLAQKKSPCDFVFLVWCHPGRELVSEVMPGMDPQKGAFEDWFSGAFGLECDVEFLASG